MFTLSCIALQDKTSVKMLSTPQTLFFSSRNLLITNRTKGSQVKKKSINHSFYYNFSFTKFYSIAVFIFVSSHERKTNFSSAIPRVFCELDLNIILIRREA